MITIVPFFAAAAVIAPVSDPPQQDRRCRDVVVQVREANGRKMLDRNTAKPGEPLLILAVERRIDGCRVLVMANDHSDVRPEPKPSDGKPLRQPAR